MQNGCAGRYNNGNTITFRDVLTSIFFSSVDMITFYSGPITVSYIIIMIIIDQPLVRMHTYSCPFTVHGGIKLDQKH